MAAPEIVFWSRHDVRLDGIKYDVSNDVQRVRLFFNQQRFEASLKNVTNASMAFIECLRISTVEPVHAPRESLDRQLHDEMKMIGHQGIGGENPAKAVDRFTEEIKKGLPIEIVAKNRFFAIATCEHVKECA